MKKICVLGNFSGRNAGDAAILGCLLKDVSERYENALFEIPTINTNFVRNSYSEYNIKPISLLPWNLSAKILGVPVFRSTLNADLVLSTDAILFDRRLYNPLFNYLWTLSIVLPMVKKRGIPFALYNSSLGPIKTNSGAACLKRVVSSADLVILRDKVSLELMKKLDFTHPNVIEGADCALNSEPVDDQEFERIKEKEGLFESGRPTIGININSYVDKYVSQSGQSFGRDNLTTLYARTVDRLVKDLDVDILFVETQHMDLGIAFETLSKIKNRTRVKLISNKIYSYRQICSVLKRLDLFVGMRTHSLIMASAMGVPVAGINTYPKNRGYMQTIGMDGNLIEFKDLSIDAFFDLIKGVYESKETHRDKMLPLVEQEKNKAAGSADHLKKIFT